MLPNNTHMYFKTNKKNTNQVKFRPGPHPLHFFNIYVIKICFGLITSPNPLPLYIPGGNKRIYTPQQRMVKLRGFLNLKTFSFSICLTDF